jgi:uncharacterized protein YbaP (TraB family)
MFVDAGRTYAQGFHYIVKRRGETVADIVGTNHTGEEALYRLNPTIESASIKAKKIAFENIFTQERTDKIELSLITTKYIVQDYYTDFNDKNYKENIACKYPSSIQENEIIEHNNAYGTESLILKARGENSNTVIPLETPEEHAEALNCLEMQEIFLEDQYYSNKVSDEEVKAVNTDSYEEVKAVNTDSYDAFRKGDETLGKQVMKWRKYHDPASHHYITKKRNHTFASRAVPLIEESNLENRVLIAVGYTHLLGKHGVPSLLRQKLGEEYSIEKSLL